MTVRVGFLGAGLIATFHSKRLRRSDADVAWAGVYDPDLGRRDAFAQASGAVACRSEEEVLDTCDAVYVCAWTSEHRRLVSAAAERGVAVFCEKPLAVDLAGAAAMASAVAGAGVVNQVGLILRASPAFTLLRDLVAAPASGRPMSVVFRDDQFIPVQGHYRSTWRGDVARAGSGTLLEHSIHDVDLLEWLLGPITGASARSAEFHGLAGIEDAVAATVGFASGAVGSLVSVWHDVLERPSLRRVEVLCERAFLVLEGDWFGPVRWTLTGSDEGSLAGDELVADVRARHPGWTGNPDRAFVAAVAEGRPAHPDFAEAVRAHAVVDALYRSAAAGGAAVDVPPPRSGGG